MYHLFRGFICMYYGAGRQFFCSPSEAAIIIIGPLYTYAEATLPAPSRGGADRSWVAFQQRHGKSTHDQESFLTLTVWTWDILP